MHALTAAFAGLHTADPMSAAGSRSWAAPTWLKHPNIKLYLPKRVGAFAGLRKLHKLPGHLALVAPKGPSESDEI